MRLYVTADWHINHKNVIKYCNRPFEDIEHMNNTIIDNANQRCKEDDFLWHLGDLMFAKSSQAYVTHTFKDIMDQVNSHLYLIRGNHDRNNGGKNLMLYSVLLFANIRYLFCHIPPMSSDFKNPIYQIPHATLSSVDCILCGHVHQNWDHQYYEIWGNKIPVINVGVDVRNFYPIAIDEVNVIYQRLRKAI